MLFHLFCMIDDHWGMELRSLNSAGKSIVKIQYLRRPEEQSGHLGFISELFHEGGQKESLGGAQGAHTTSWRGQEASRASRW